MPLELSDVLDAHNRIKPYIHETPVMESQQLNDIVGCELFFKCEHLQKAGAFKSRGAVNAVFSPEQGALSAGVATHSSGNHGAAVARAARLRGIAAHIVVPENAKQVKKDAIAGYGASIIECESNLAAREETLRRIISDTGAAVVHPYDDECVIAGQGTATVEFLDQVPGLDAVVTPVGGGGLLAGSALVTRDRCLIYGAEPEQADDAFRSFHSGKLVKDHRPDTICDGLQTTLGKKNFIIIKDHVTDILLVSEQDIIDAMFLIWTRLKQLVEPSSAITLAAMIKNRELFAGQKVGLILTGGNLDLASLPF